MKKIDKIKSVNFVKTLLILLLSLHTITLSGQANNCDFGVVPDDLRGDKISINLGDVCSSCGPYGGGNGTIDNPPNGATGCGIIRIRQEVLEDCVIIGIDPQATEKTDYYFNPLLDTTECFTPDASTTSQGDNVDVLKSSLTLVNGFYDILVCSQSTGNRSYKITIGCCPRAGTGSSVGVCDNDDSVLDLYTLILGEDPDGTWTRMSGSGGTFNDVNGTFTPAIGATTSTFQYAAAVDPNSPECNLTSLVTINITAAPYAGIDDALTICSDGDPINLHELLGPNAEEDGAWSGPSLLDGGFLGTLDPGTDNSGSYIYVVNGSSPCTNDTSEVMVVIEGAVTAGSAGSIAFCIGQTEPITMLSGLGGMPDTGGAWSPSTTVDGIFDPNNDTPGIYTYTVMGTSPCNNASAEVEIIMSTLPSAGENGSVSVCDNDPIFNLIDFLNGNPDGGGNWAPILNSNTGLFDPSIDSPGNYTYSFNIEDCETESAQVSVSIDTAPDGGSSGSIEMCDKDDPINLYDYINNADQNGMWSGPSTLDNGYLGTFDPKGDLSGIYAYTISAELPCSEVVTTMMVSNNDAPYAGRDTTISACISDNAMNLFDLLGDDVDKGGTWTPELQSATNMFMPALDGPGTYTYTLAATASCAESSAHVTTVVYEGKHAGQSGIYTINSTDPPIDLFTLLTMNPDPGGTWDPAPLSGTGLFDPAVDQEGTFTYHVAADGACLGDSANIAVSLLDMHGIPTLSTWGMIVLLILFLIIGKVYLLNYSLVSEGL